MAQTINLNDKLSKENPKVIIFDREIKVNKGALAYAKYTEFQENTANRFKEQIDAKRKNNKDLSIDEIKQMVIADIKDPFAEIFKVLEIFISKEDVQYILDFDFSIEELNTILNAIIAASKNMTLEEYEKKIEENKYKKKVN